MTRVIACALAAFSGVGAVLAADEDREGAKVPVAKVVLFSSGVGYFEHHGEVSGNATTELRFNRNQVNDILKSLVLEDLDGGRVGTVVYPSQDPLAKTLASFEVDIRTNPPLGELLNQLRGTTVRVKALAEEMTGTILGLEKKRVPVEDGAPVDRWVLNLLSGGTIRAVELDAVSQLELLDEQLQEELNKALGAFAEGRDQDKKPVVIHFDGQGQRRVRLGYVVETPIWKTTYRLVMPVFGTDSGKMQGWAIVENQTESDWNNVDLALVSGRPISFVQDLYQPLYVPRPVVQPELYASLAPQAYGGAVAGHGGAAPMADEEARGRRKSKRRGGLRAEADASVMEMNAGAPIAASPAMSRRAFNAVASVASLATASDVGELFQYRVPAVTLPRRRSAMIPIVTDDVQAERVSIYNQQVMAKHPLHGALLTNTTGKHLQQGPITVLDDGAYAGDARIEDLPPGQHRLLSYAVDLGVRVDASSGRNETALQTGSIVRGVLHLKRKRVSIQDYTVQNKDDRNRAMIVEHPVHSGWKLVDTIAPFEQTEQLYRFKGTVAAGATKIFTVRAERVDTERIALLNTNASPILAYARNSEIPRKVRDALARAAELKTAVEQTKGKIRRHERSIETIASEQVRIRDNMKTVASNSQYYTRLLTKLNDQETEIERIQARLADLQTTLAREEAALAEYLRTLNVD